MNRNLAPLSKLAFSWAAACFCEATWTARRWTIDLDYRSGIKAAAEIQEDLHRQQAAEQAAHAAGDLQLARDCRAQAERMTG